MWCRRLLCAGLLGALLLGAGEAQAQRGLPGQLGIGFSAGTVDGLLMRDKHLNYRFWGGLDVVRYNRNHSYWNFSSECLRKDYLYVGIGGNQVIPMAQFTAQTGYNVPLLSDRGRHLSLVAGISGLLGYETSGWGNKLLRDGSRLACDDGFIYGPAVSLTLEGYLSDRVVMLLKVRERCMFGSQTGKFHTQLGFGFRFIIN